MQNSLNELTSLKFSWVVSTMTNTCSLFKKDIGKVNKACEKDFVNKYSFHIF